MKTLKSILLPALLCITINASAQLKVPAPSPLQTIKQAFALSDITIEYSRPSAKGRVIYGDLVPFGKIWRTGANQATKITFGEDVKVEGMPIVAGTYAVYTIPNKDVWEVMFYKDLTLGGDVAEYKTENEVLRVKVKPVTMASKVETFTIDIANMTSKTASIELVWEQTRVPIKIEADIDTKIMKNIETAMAPADKRPFYQAASYYYENDKDLKQALEWVNKAVEQNPKAYWVMLLKSKIQYKMKDFKGAEASADQVIALATEEKNDDYVKMGKEWKEKAAKGK